MLVQPQATKFKYIHRFVDRHGIERHYLRYRRLPNIPLSGTFGSPEFITSYKLALEEAMKRANASGALSEYAKKKIKKMKTIWKGRTPPESGVYFLVLNDEIIYIGSSINIAARVLSHKTNGREFDTAYAMEAPESSRLSLERLMIRKLKPRQNKAWAG